jgi:predicted dehydrogenase
MPSLEANGMAFLQAVEKQTFINPPRVLIIGAGSRGTAYAEAALSSTNSILAAVCEPSDYKRVEFGRKFIWGKDEDAKDYQAFYGWQEWKEYEIKRREHKKAGHEVEKGIDAVFVCVLDEMHEEVVCGIADMGVHISCEKPMSTRLDSCMRMYRALRAPHCGNDAKETIFGICHVLRYSPHNMLLRHLVLEKDVIGDVLSIEHVEPVGWWHFSHSYVR